VLGLKGFSMLRKSLWHRNSIFYTGETVMSASTPLIITFLINKIVLLPDDPSFSFYSVPNRLINETHAQTFHKTATAPTRVQNFTSNLDLEKYMLWNPRKGL